jgi:hypothetical protein
MITDVKHITRDETLKTIFNPLKRDFVDRIRDDDNQEREYKIRSMETGTFPTYITNHVRKHLIDAVKNEREISGTDLKAIEEIEKEVDVDGI